MMFDEIERHRRETVTPDWNGSAARDSTSFCAVS
jgi:hypothetical protein